MKFLIDECVSRLIFNFLKNYYDTKHVQDAISGVDDDEVLAVALAENRVIVTCDKDFGDLVFRDKKQHLGIILLRLNSTNPASQLVMLKKVIDEYIDQIEGNFIVATDCSVKVIKLILH